MAHHSHGETQTSPADLLLDYLEELSDEELKEFKWKLNHTKYKELKPLSRGQLENLDRTDLTDKMISVYGEADALNIMLEMLRNMNLNDLDQRLNASGLQKDPTPDQAGDDGWMYGIQTGTILSGRLKSLGSWGTKGRRREEEKLEKDRGKLMSSMIKCNLKQKCECVFEGKAKGRQPALLNEIYTELYITEGGTGGVNDEHEVRQIETASKKRQREDTTVKCNDIFKPLCGRETSIKTVLTKGVAGIGKTVSVQKFILDWAEGKANQDVHFIFALPFRDLNMIKGEYSLIELLHHFVPELKSLKSTELLRYKILFIFDGLDECRLPLDFQNNGSWFDVTKKMSLDVLLTNLIKGDLLPSAVLWITSRPAAANQIPPAYIDQVTEIRGFSDAQKEEYFRRRFGDESLASRIITHVKSSRSLFIMCHIPVFCWISATVLEMLFSETDRGEIPGTLTEMYTHFLIFQSECKTDKYMNKLQLKTHSKEFLLKLGKLAFDNLEKGNLIFYEQDLKENDIDVAEASVYSGVCTEVFKEECGFYQEKVYCFVHLSIQEYLAALYMFLSNSSADLLETEVDQALESKNGHLDLYLRFLLGLSTDSSKTLLKRLLGQTGTSSHNIEKTAKYIKEKIQENLSPERTINLFHCLTELGDNSLVEEMQRYLNSGSLSAEDLSPAQYSALAFVMLMSDEELDVFDLKKFIRSDKEHWRLLPVVKNSRTALLNSCNLTEKCCEALASALRSNSSPLRELDLSDNDLQDSGVKLLSAGLGDSHCKLEILRLSACRVTEEGCSSLASALRSNPSHLRELDLSYNHTGDSGVKLLSAALEDPSCKLQILSSNMQDTAKFMKSEKPSSLKQCRASTSVTVAWNWIPELVSRNKHLFIPDVVETTNVTEYRFQVNHAGRFFCCVTGLVFVMKSSGGLSYSFCSWEKAPKPPGSWSQAGPLFGVECPQGTLKNLHFPHCEMSCADEDLAVAHVTEDNMEILQPLEVTDTHVVISITSLSLFGVIKRKIFPMVRGQVLLLVRPIAKILNVFLLPLNVSPDQVHQQEQQKENILIPTSSMCKLIHNEQYRISCDHEAIRRIQPENEEFEYNFDQTIHPTFEVFLNCDEGEVELSVLKNRSGEVVWQRFVILTGAVPASPSMTDTGVAFVDQHRTAIIQRVSLIEPLLDDLHENIGAEKYDDIRACRSRQDKMRRLYEVLNTDRLKKLFFDSLKKNESHLVLDLLG
ncbi:NACHT, LRR and PYD domains-containing protein 12-like [Brienomyrus brachyistius]|uniref:NACHT, LRR and PYD domains-containing protein 12-like n=1 Tax=Brienomyrus brachyistius TaxID=42636 RepID=UPI0020B24A40|nr:NACHT, LRR and PYD domains-containing protein 12-like [Brienomyrus brachyistius]